jgi:hypothetical protein
LLESLKHGHHSSVRIPRRSLLCRQLCRAAYGVGYE